jgi:uncharacterized protein YbaP (TraB family)
MHACLTSSLRLLAQRSRFALAFAAIAGALLTASSSACAQSPTAAERSPSARATESTPKRGLLYEIRSDAGTVYLFGTLHVGKPDFYPLDLRVNRAFAASGSVYLEVNLSDAALMQTASELATYREGAGLDRTLAPSVMSKVDAALKRYQLPREAAVRMKPWMLGQTLLLLEATRRGYDPAYATEMHLLSLAAAQRKEVRGLETLEEQLSIFDRLPDAAQQRFLEEILEALDDPRMGGHLDSLVDAWAHADARGAHRGHRPNRENDLRRGRCAAPGRPGGRHRASQGSRLPSARPVAGESGSCARPTAIFVASRTPLV